MLWTLALTQRIGRPKALCVKQAVVEQFSAVHDERVPILYMYAAAYHHATVVYKKVLIIHLSLTPYYIVMLTDIR